MLRVMLALCLVAAAGTACGTAAGGGSLIVLGSWSGPEKDQFNQVLDKFRQQYHVNVSYQGTRALGQVLQADVNNGDAPDVAILPSPAALATYADSHTLVPLDSRVAGDYSPQWQDLTSVGGRRYAVVVKAGLKSIVWYDPKRLDPFLAGGPPPATWDQLVALERRITGAGGVPWCLGMAANSTSGWPGTDWIEDIVLHEFGQDFYSNWVNGTVSWQDPRIRLAWQQWGSVLTPGSGTAALFTGFDQAGKLMFSAHPGCYLDHEGSFIINDYPPVRPGADVDYFPFPTIGGSGTQATEVSADLAGLFRDSVAGRELMAFLASDTAQAIWPHIAGSGAFSVDRNVGPTVYHDDVARAVVKKLVGPDTLCFDASDLMPADLTSAFYQAVLRYLVNPGQLDQLLAQLDTVRLHVYNGQQPTFHCGLARH